MKSTYRVIHFQDDDTVAVSQEYQTKAAAVRFAKCLVKASPHLSFYVAEYQTGYRAEILLRNYVTRSGNVKVTGNKIFRPWLAKVVSF